MITFCQSYATVTIRKVFVLVGHSVLAETLTKQLYHHGQILLSIEFSSDHALHSCERPSYKRVYLICLLHHPRRRHHSTKPLSHQSHRPCQTVLMLTLACEEEPGLPASDVALNFSDVSTYRSNDDRVESDLRLKARDE